MHCIDPQSRVLLFEVIKANNINMHKRDKLKLHFLKIRYEGFQINDVIEHIPMHNSVP